MPEMPEQLALRIKTHARTLGFHACAIAAAEPPDPEDRLGAWLARGFHADMDWMDRTREIRQDVRLKLPGAKSVVVVAMNYKQPEPPRPAGAGRVAMYAWGRDYHKVIKRQLRLLAEFTGGLGQTVSCDIGVDSAPFLERAWAAKAGLGWIGKNGMVLNRELGSWFFLGVMATTLELAPDTPALPHCGTCRACMDACPTAAIVESGVVDATKCISYQTIENRATLDTYVASKLGDWVFGCDICQEVCPWNRFAPDTDQLDFFAREGVPHPDLRWLANCSEAEFTDMFAGTPVMRAKHAGMQRNAAAVRPPMDG